MAGDYFHFQRQHTRKTGSYEVATSDDFSSTAKQLVAVKSANHTLYLQKLEISITTYAAKTWTFQDSSGTAVVNGVISIAAAAEAHVSESGTIVLDFGPTGLALTKGKDFQLKNSATGAGGQVHWEMYEKIDGAVALSQQTLVSNQAQTAPVLN